MATRKRSSSRSSRSRAARSPIGQAVKVGRTALRQAEKRIPPDVRRQLERTLRDGQARFDKAFKEVRTRVTKAAGQADLDRARKNLEGLSKLVQETVGAFAQRSRAAATTTARRSTRAATSARRTATRKAATTKRAVTRKASTTKRATTRKASTTRSAAARKPATRSAAAAKPAARPSTTRRRSSSRRRPAVRTVPPAVQETPGPVPQRVEMTGDGA